MQSSPDNVLYRAETNCCGLCLHLCCLQMDQLRGVSLAVVVALFSDDLKKLIVVLLFMAMLKILLQIHSSYNVCGSTEFDFL